MPVFLCISKYLCSMFYYSCLPATICVHVWIWDVHTYASNQSKRNRRLGVGVDPKTEQAGSPAFNMGHLRDSQDFIYICQQSLSRMRNCVLPDNPYTHNSALSAWKNFAWPLAVQQSRVSCFASQLRKHSRTKGYVRMLAPDFEPSVETQFSSSALFDIDSREDAEDIHKPPMNIGRLGAPFVLVNG
jgi:hypothetical protein